MHIYVSVSLKLSPNVRSLAEDIGEVATGQDNFIFLDLKVPKESVACSLNPNRLVGLKSPR